MKEEHKDTIYKYIKSLIETDPILAGMDADQAFRFANATTGEEQLLEIAEKYLNS